MIDQSRNTLRERERLNAICPYFTMFPLNVPLECLRNSDERGWVLDPFCGRGTTNYAARLLGMGSVGIDSNPVAAAIAEGKMVATTADGIVAECSTILGNKSTSDPPDGEFWSMCFHPRTLQDLSILRATLLDDCSSPERRALRALLLGLLHGPRNKGAPSYLSNQMPRTYASKPDYSVRYWTTRSLGPSYVDLSDLVRRKALHYFAYTPPNTPFHILCGDSRTFDFASLGIRFSNVVTSPPYYGMRTYVPDQWLRYWFLGGPPFVTYKHPCQLSHGSRSEFVAQLASVWANVARVCRAGALLTIRFGGISDRNARPQNIMLDAIQGAPCRLRVLDVRSAGLSTFGKRQADQFKRRMGKPIEELDFFVRLEEPYHEEAVQ